MNMYWHGAFGCKCRLCTLYGLCPGTYFWFLIQKKVEVINFELRPPHISFLRQLSTSPLERASMQYCAPVREQELIRVRNSSLAQDGGEVVVLCVLGFAREVASRVSWKYSIAIAFRNNAPRSKVCFQLSSQRFEREIWEEESDVLCVRHNGWTSEGKCCVSVDKELAGKTREVNWERVWWIAVCDCTVGTV